MIVEILNSALSFSALRKQKKILTNRSYLGDTQALFNNNYNSIVGKINVIQTSVELLYEKIMNGFDAVHAIKRQASLMDQRQLSQILQNHLGAENVLNTQKKLISDELNELSLDLHELEVMMLDQMENNESGQQGINSVKHFMYNVMKNFE